MFRKGLNFLLAVFLVTALAGLSACGSGQIVPMQAVQGGGLLSSRPSDINSKNAIVDSSTGLTIEVTNFCNGEAQVDYGWLAGFCGNSPNFTIPTMPVSIQTNIGTQIASQGKAAWCQSNLWTGPSGQLSIPVDSAKNPLIPTLGNCPTGAAPAPVTAPSGAAAAAK